MKYKRANIVPWRIVDGKAVLISVKNSEVLVLNDLGTEIWRLLDVAKEVDQIVEHVYKSFNAEKEDIQKDTVSFIEELKLKEVLDER